MADGLSRESRSVLELHDCLNDQKDWIRADLTIDQSKGFFGFMYFHRVHQSLVVKAGICKNIGAIRVELSDATVGEWAELSNPLIVEDVLYNLEASIEEIKIFLNEAGVDSIDDLPSEEDILDDPED